MIKFNGKVDGSNLLGLGLSRENVSRLVDGQPIMINTKEMNLGDFPWGKIFIFFGETEEDMAKELEDMGAINAKTQYRQMAPSDGDNIKKN